MLNTCTCVYPYCVKEWANVFLLLTMSSAPLKRLYKEVPVWIVEDHHHVGLPQENMSNRNKCRCVLIVLTGTTTELWGLYLIPSLSKLCAGGVSNLSGHCDETPSYDKHQDGSPGLSSWPAHPRQHVRGHGLRQRKATGVNGFVSSEKWTVC